MSETVTCEGCLLQINPNDCTRTWTNDRWYFFCRTCEHDGTRNEVLRKVNHEHESKSGTASLQR